MGGLNEKDLNEVKNKAEFLLIDKQKIEKDNIRLQQFYGVVQEIISEKLKINKISYRAFRCRSNFNKFKKSYKDLNEYMKVIKIKNKKATYYKFYFIFVNLLINWLQKCKIPISMNTIINNIDKIPGLIDQAYPEYIQNDLIHLIK